MKAVVYITEIQKQYEQKNMEHMTGEKLLEEALFKEYGLNLAYEPRAKGERGKPFFTLQPKIHYNISHSGKYVVCVLADKEIGIDIQKHKEVNFSRLLERMVPEEQYQQILQSENITESFYTQWVLREAYVKWTGEGFSKDFRKIPMDRGCYSLLEMEDGYSGAVWAGEPMEIRVEYVEVKIP